MFKRSLSLSVLLAMGVLGSACQPSAVSLDAAKDLLNELPVEQETQKEADPFTYEADFSQFLFLMITNQGGGKPYSLCETIADRYFYHELSYNSFSGSYAISTTEKTTDDCSDDHPLGAYLNQEFAEIPGESKAEADPLTTEENSFRMRVSSSRLNIYDDSFTGVGDSYTPFMLAINGNQNGNFSEDQEMIVTVNFSERTLTVPFGSRQVALKLSAALPAFGIDRTR